MDEKCSARMLALLVASLCTTPWCRSGEMPELSLPVDLKLVCLSCQCVWFGCVVNDNVGRNLWICAIHGTACAICGSIVCAEIHGCLRNLWILRRMQIISL